MLLILGSDNDPNARRIADHTHIHNVPYKQLDPAELDKFSLNWTLNCTKLVINDEAFTPQALYLRHDVFTEDSEEVSDLLYASLEGYGLTHPGVRMLNRSTTGSNNNKCYNLSVAQRLGLRIPETHIATANQPIRDIFFEDDSRFVAKPLEGGDHTVPLHALDKLYHKYKSVFIQEQLLGRNIRQFVIGGKSFAFELTTTDLDYRTDPDVEVISTELDVGIRALGESLAKELGFDYCALDYRENLDGDVFFLEINSFPMFSVFDDACSNALADAQLRFLCDGWFNLS